MSTNAEDQARQGFEAGRSYYEVNYPFVYPSAAEVGEDFQKNMGWARYPRSVKDKASRPPLGGINIGVSKYGETPDLAFEAAECIASEQHQGDAAELGGLPPTTESVYETEQVKKAYPFADLLRESIEAAAPRPVTPAYSDISLAIQKTYSPPDGIDPNGIVAEAEGPDRASRGREDLLMEAAAGAETARQATRRRRRRITDRAQGRAQARLAAVRAGRDRDAGRDRLSDRLRGLPVAAALRPALPRRQGVRRPLELLRRAHLEHLVGRRLEHGGHHRRLGVARARARHGDRARHAPRDLRPRPGARGDPDPLRDHHRGRRVRLEVRVRPDQRLRRRACR